MTLAPLTRSPLRLALRHLATRPAVPAGGVFSQPITLPITLLITLLAATPVRAEPYLAVREGLKCVACHVNPTGGGKRNAVGNLYGQAALPAEPSADGGTRGGTATPPDPPPWTGQIGAQIAIGGDLRATTQAMRRPAGATTAGSRSLEFNPVRAQLYLEVKPLGERLTLLVDEHVASGTATAREAWALLWLAERRAYLKAGRIFVPFGLRIEDDTAYIRQVTGTNFNASDDGVEGGLELGPWSASLALTNGAGGGNETNRGKQVSALVSLVQPGWRLGLSSSVNTADTGDRRMHAAFGGLRTGPVSWLASAVYIDDAGGTPPRLRQWVSLLEGNVELARGHNLKLAAERRNPNMAVREDEQARYSAVWEFVPWPFTQLRLGARKADGIPQAPAQNTTELFAQWHAYF